MIYLLDDPPRRSQFRAVRRQVPSGVVVLHTAESVLDTVGPDTGAEAVARFIRDRTDPGSYHDLADSDSNLQLVPYTAEAYQDGTGSNPHALSISFALSATDWPNLTSEQRAGFLRQGAVAFTRQQQWLRDHNYPTTPLHRITREQSEQRVPGFVTHGDRDEARRSDPGGRPDRFPWQEWFDACASALAGTTTPQEDEDSMPMTQDELDRVARRVAEFVAAGTPAENGTANVRRLLARVLDELVLLPGKVADEMSRRQQP